MIAVLSISKVFSNGYLVQVDGGEPGEPYATIAQAIADHEDMPREYAQFVNIEYQGVRLATLPVQRMKGRSRELANELMQLLAEIHDAE